MSYFLKRQRGLGVKDVSKCPRCQATNWHPVDNQRRVQRCGQCQGTWLNAEAVEPFLREGVGIDPSLIPELATHFSGERLDCPGCHEKMSPLPLRAKPIDMCLACHHMWLDQGELSSLTNGRIGEEGPPEPQSELDLKVHLDRPATALAATPLASPAAPSASTAEGAPCHACPGEFFLSAGAGMGTGKTISGLTSFAGIFWYGFTFAFTLGFLLASLMFFGETFTYRYRCTRCGEAPKQLSDQDRSLIWKGRKMTLMKSVGCFFAALGVLIFI